MWCRWSVTVNFGGLDVLSTKWTGPDAVSGRAAVDCCCCSWCKVVMRCSAIVRRRDVMTKTCHVMIDDTLMILWSRLCTACGEEEETAYHFLEDTERVWWLDIHYLEHTLWSSMSCVTWSLQLFTIRKNVKEVFFITYGIYRGCAWAALDWPQRWVACAVRREGKCKGKERRGLACRCVSTVTRLSYHP